MSIYFGTNIHTLAHSPTCNHVKCIHTRSHARHAHTRFDENRDLCLMCSRLSPDTIRDMVSLRTIQNSIYNELLMYDVTTYVRTKISFV